jgi:hypothetical protein
MKYDVRRNGVAALGLLLSLCGRAAAQCEVVEDCATVQYLLPGQSWKDPDDQWQPNRLPAAMIQLTRFNWCRTQYDDANARGLQQWWCTSEENPTSQNTVADAMGALEDRFMDAYTAGYRRIILQLPAGTVFNQAVASAQYWGMPQAKRQALCQFIAAQAASKPDLRIEIYSAFPNIPDPFSLCMQENPYPEITVVDDEICTYPEDPNYGRVYYPCLGSPPAWTPSPFSQESVCDFHNTHKPWRNIGVKRVWLDESARSDLIDHFVEFAYNPNYRTPAEYDGPHFLGMESIPSYDPPGTADWEIDMVRAERAPAIGFARFMYLRDPDKSWDISDDAAITELNVPLQHAGEPYATYFDVDHMFGVLAWAQRGFVLIAQTPFYPGPGMYVLTPEEIGANQLTEYMKRVYDFGEIKNRRDFNGDGAINSQDWADYNTAWNLYNGKTACNWVHGDVDQDNDVDNVDKAKYQLWYAAPVPPGQSQPPVVSIHLGPADPMDALTKP